MWQLLLTAALLLLASSGTQAEDLRKAVVSLYPEWDRLLEKDNVTLRCQGTHTNGHDSTRWWHNGNLLPNQNSSYVISSARVNDSGEYTCQTNLSKLSDPVLLQVHAAWLLLQARQWVAQEGDPIKLRCHSWKNVPVHNVQYFQNGRGVQFSYQNFDFHIPKASGKHNGSYFCRGIIGTLNVSSEAVNIIVQAPAASLVSPGRRALYCLLLGALFAVDTGLHFSVWRDLRSLLRNRRDGGTDGGTDGAVTRSKSPGDERER